MQVSWRNFFRRERLDCDALQSLARERFPNRSDEVAARVLKVLHTKYRFGSRHLFPRARLAVDLGFDDLDFFDMIKAIEEALDLQIPVDDFGRASTLDDLIASAEKANVQQDGAANSHRAGQ